MINWTQTLLFTFLPPVSLMEMLNINKTLPTTTQKTYPRKKHSSKNFAKLISPHHRSWYPGKTIFESAYVNRLEMGQKSEHQSEFRHHHRIVSSSAEEFCNAKEIERTKSSSGHYSTPIKRPPKTTTMRWLAGWLEKSLTLLPQWWPTFFLFSFKLNKERHGKKDEFKVGNFPVSPVGGELAWRGRGRSVLRKVLVRGHKNEKAITRGIH